MNVRKRASYSIKNINNKKVRAQTRVVASLFARSPTMQRAFSTFTIFDQRSDGGVVAEYTAEELSGRRG